ncbi:hypothetical protein [Acinetobacter sp. YH12153]|uniref:hypothetical protein n=1 Tax=Acinetobacter sp. YH12153 TaxID=2601133 RepID=UPI0015D1C07B|nr:hypothetical protein [Acinetobacter sp. YH12153]
MSLLNQIEEVKQALETAQVPSDLILRFANSHKLAQIIRKHDNAIVAQVPDHLAQNLAADHADFRAKGYTLAEATYRAICTMFNYEKLVVQERVYGYAQ